jgi:hypothetical protein
MRRLTVLLSKILNSFETEPFAGEQVSDSIRIHILESLWAEPCVLVEQLEGVLNRCRMWPEYRSLARAMVMRQ